MTERLLTTARVAALLHVSEEVIVRAVAAKAGTLRGVRGDGGWMVLEPSLVALAGIDGDATARDVVTLEDAAALLGMSVSQAQIEAKAHKLPAFRVGREWRIRRVDAEKRRSARDGRPREQRPMIERVDAAKQRPAERAAVEPLPPNQLRTTGDVARRLNVSERHVITLASSAKQKGKPKLYALKLGKIWRFTDEQVEAFIDELQRVSLGEEIE